MQSDEGPGVDGKGNVDQSNAKTAKTDRKPAPKRRGRKRKGLLYFHFSYRML